MNTLSKDKFHLFSKLDQATFRNLLSSGEKFKVSKNDFVFKEGDFNSKLYFVLNGKVKIGSTLSSGQWILKDVIDTGHIFGEEVLTQINSRKEFAQAMTHHVEILSIDKSYFLKIMHNNKLFSKDVIQYSMLKMKSLERRIDHYIFKKAKARIANYLCVKANSSGIKIGIDELLINLNMSHKEIAHITDTSRQTVARVLGELKQANFIHFSARKPAKILVRNLNGLTSISN